MSAHTFETFAGAVPTPFVPYCNQSPWTFRTSFSRSSVDCQVLEKTHQLPSLMAGHAGILCPWTADQSHRRSRGRQRCRRDHEQFTRPSLNIVDVVKSVLIARPMKSRWTGSIIFYKSQCLARSFGVRIYTIFS